jgi:hypothetical protein
MARYFVTQDGPHDFPPFARGGSYRVWDELKPEPIREIPWYESRGAPLDDGGKTLSQEQAREYAYSVARALNGQKDSADAYRRRKWHHWEGKAEVDKETLKLLRKRVGRTAVGPSTARGMGPAGTIQSARTYLQELDLKAFAIKTQTAFHRRLDSETDSLIAALPKSARHWGSARKFLNIFIRNCAYNRFLCDAYGLAQLEQWMEVPLDSHVAKGLRLEPEGENLPRWRTVIDLSRAESDVWQSVALKVATRKGIERVHLDLHYWNGAHTLRARWGRHGKAMLSDKDVEKALDIWNDPKKRNALFVIFIGLLAALWLAV